MARYGVRLETDPRLTPQDCQELARRAEDLGYESVWLPEGHSRDAFTSLAAMALSTQRIKLGTGIIQVFARTASNTAMAASGMAALSGGRFILGLGVGHGPNVESWDGVPFKQPITRLRETIQIARGLLSGERVEFSGKQFKVSGASLEAAAPSGTCISLLTSRAFAAGDSSAICSHTAGSVASRSLISSRESRMVCSFLISVSRRR